MNYLSEAFETPPDEPNLELKVITLNINEGHNPKLMEQCQILREYAQYVAKVRSYTVRMPLNEAVTLAVNDCIKEGILEEFLRKNRSEVIAMSIFEYNKEEEERKIRKAEYEAGETHILNLIQCLTLDGRSDEIPKLATDRNLLNALLKEYNL